MCAYTKPVTVVLQAEAAGAERGWDGAKEKCHIESSAPVTGFEHHNQYRQKGPGLENVEKKPQRMAIFSTHILLTSVLSVAAVRCPFLW